MSNPPVPQIPETMHALEFDGQLRLVGRPVPMPMELEALIRVRVAGICNTDMEITRGYMDFRGVPGHEFVGEVVDGDDKEWLGKRVVGEINLGCGDCDWCLEGLSRHCPSRSTLGISGKDGTFAEYVTMPLGNLHLVPDSIPDSRAVFIEPLAAAVEILEQVPVDPTWRVLVIGDGKLAILIARVLMQLGIDLTVLGMVPSKLELFRKSGVRVIQHPENPGSEYDLVVEASGSPNGWHLAMDAVRPRGIIVLKSTYHGNLDWNPAPLVINEVTLVGSRCGPFAPALKLLSDLSFETQDIVDAVFPFDRALEALERAQSPSTLKVIIAMMPLDDFSGFPSDIIQNFPG
jgi:threonine dehydrogenase-like Zn-dependent dehydrogenase